MIQNQTTKKYLVYSLVISLIAALIGIIIQKDKQVNLVIIGLVVFIPFMLNALVLTYHLHMLNLKNGKHTASPFVNAIIIVLPIVILGVLKVEQVVLITCVIALAISRITDQVVRIIVFRGK